MDENNSKVIKASFYYIICSILTKGISFFTTPFFSRILTEEEYGIASNFSSWMSIIIIIASLSLIASLMRARFDFESDYGSYVSSILLLGLISSSIAFAVIFSRIAFFERVFSLNRKYLYLMCASVLADPAYTIFLQNQRYEYKYKTVTALTIVITVCSVALSFLFIYLFEDNLWGKTLGGQLPYIVASAIIYLYYFIKSFDIKTKYWKYAVLISFPYIFHLLSSSLLSFSDRIIITHLCGERDNAMYTMACNVGMIVSVILYAMNEAFAPWIGEKIHENSFSSLKSAGTRYVLSFYALIVGMMLVTPEVLFVLGGKKYYSAISVIPPVMMAYIFVFIDTLYVNILQYEKKTTGMAFATMTSALLNIFLNFIFIPRYGYIAAAYTTVVGYIVLLTLDFFFAYKNGFGRTYNHKAILLATGGVLFAIISMFWLYKQAAVRYVLLFCYLMAIFVVAWKNRELIISFLKRRD